jgi:hypothetical protein
MVCAAVAVGVKFVCWLIKESKSSQNIAEKGEWLK